MFTPPTWWMGTLTWLMFCIPLLICLIFTIYSGIKFMSTSSYDKEDGKYYASWYRWDSCD